jgi:hypothetical protein
MEDDRKTALAAAFEAAEAATGTDESTTTAENVEQKDIVSEPKEAVTTSEAADNETAVETSKVVIKPPKEEAEPAEEKPVEKAVNTDRAPQAWKPAQKAKWAALDSDIREEVLRREHETTRVLNDTAQARHFATSFHQAVQPYMARIQQIGDPVKAVQNLLAADNLLATGPKVAKAQYVAKLIQDYGVDIQELDSALAGNAPTNPVESQVEQLLQQRLAPIQQFLTAQQQREMAAQQASQQQLVSAITQMSQDPAYPYFEDVRETMADVVELMSKRGVSIDLKEAYNRAVAMDPSISQAVAAAAEATARSQKAAAANAKAQRALRASASVGGAPGGSLDGKPVASDRRAALVAAFDSFEGR